MGELQSWEVTVWGSRGVAMWASVEAMHCLGAALCWSCTVYESYDCGARLLPNPYLLHFWGFPYFFVN